MHTFPPMILSCVCVFRPCPNFLSQMSENHGIHLYSVNEKATVFGVFPWFSVAHSLNLGWRVCSDVAHEGFLKILSFKSMFVTSLDWLQVWQQFKQLVAISDISRLSANICQHPRATKLPNLQSGILVTDCYNQFIEKLANVVLAFLPNCSDCCDHHTCKWIHGVNKQSSRCICI